jgi:hypothetical protein
MGVSHGPVLSLLLKLVLQPLCFDPLSQWCILGPLTCDAARAVLLAEVEQLFKALSSNWLDAWCNMVMVEATSLEFCSVLSPCIDSSAPCLNAVSMSSVDSLSLVLNIVFKSQLM